MIEHQYIESRVWTLGPWRIDAEQLLREWYYNDGERRAGLRLYQVDDGMWCCNIQLPDDTMPYDFGIDTKTLNEALAKIETHLRSDQSLTKIQKAHG